MFIQHDQFKLKLSQNISNLIKKVFDAKIDGEKIYPLLGATPSKENGDLALPLFILAKELKLSPAQAATKLQDASFEWPDFVTKVQAFGPYLNFFFDFNSIGSELIPEILNDHFFQVKLSEKSPKTMIEYSQPNTHKELHVGHMRNLCLGDALIRLHRYCQFDIISSTFPGDVGTHVAKCLWFLKFHHKGPIPSEKKGAWLGSLYSAAHQKLEEERGTEKEEQNRLQLTLILKQLEQKSGEYYELWKTTREWSIELMKKIYLKVLSNFFKDSGEILFFKFFTLSFILFFKSLL